MEIFANLSTGFAAAVTLPNLGFALVGCLLGTLIGVLPGIGPITTIAMLLPMTFGMPPLSALIMLAGIYYGAQYGGSTTAILVNMPGEVSSVVTTLDGYQMALQGRAGAALAIAALGSFFAGCVATVLVAAFSPLLASWAQEFTSAEYLSLMVFGLISAVVLAHGSVLKAVGMIMVGVLLSMIGTDITGSNIRYTFGIPELTDGLGFVSIALGLFAFSEIMINLERPAEERRVIAKVTRLWPTLSDFRSAWPAVLRGTGLGSLLGILPGGGALLGSFASYSLERKIARDPSRFGKGAIEGVAGPESANNAGAQTSFIPLLTLGFPGNPVMALMMGAMIIQGMAPGTAIIERQPELFWGMVASMWVGNLMLLVINLPLIGVWVRLVMVPYRMLFPCIVLLCCIGAYTTGTSVTEVVFTAIFAAMGYLFVKFGCEAAPLLLGYVLGPLMEENLRRTLMISRGDFMVLIERPISLGLLILSALLLAMIVLPQFRRTREAAFQE